MINIAQEKQFENKIKKYLKDNGFWNIKYFANRMTKSGVPDILACINGYFVAIEVKAEKGKTSELQYYHQKQIREAGGISIILYPNQFESFKNFINYLKVNNYELAYYGQFEFDRR